MSAADPTELELWRRARVAGPARDELAALALATARSELARRGAPPADAADLAQEAVRTLLAYVARGEDAPRDLGAFLKYRAWGVLSDYRKRQRSKSVHTPLQALPLEPADRARGPREHAERRQLLDALADCRSRLSAEQRATLELRYELGLEGDAAAQHLGVHRNTIHVRVHRALLALRECLERKGLAGGVDA